MVVNDQFVICLEVVKVMVFKIMISSTNLVLSHGKDCRTADRLFCSFGFSDENARAANVPGSEGTVKSINPYLSKRPLIKSI